MYSRNITNSPLVYLLCSSSSPTTGTGLSPCKVPQSGEAVFRTHSISLRYSFQARTPGQKLAVFEHRYIPMSLVFRESVVTAAYLSSRIREWFAG